MKGIVVTIEQFKKIPEPIKDRLFSCYSGADKIHVMTPFKDDDALGDAICAITGIAKVPIIYSNDNVAIIKWLYPKWEGETIGDY